MIVIPHFAFLSFRQWLIILNISSRAYVPCVYHFQEMSVRVFWQTLESSPISISILRQGWDIAHKLHFALILGSFL